MLYLTSLFAGAALAGSDLQMVVAHDTLIPLPGAVSTDGGALTSTVAGGLGQGQLQGVVEALRAAGWAPDSDGPGWGVWRRGDVALLVYGVDEGPGSGHESLVSVAQERALSPAWRARVPVGPGVFALDGDEAVLSLLVSDGSAWVGAFIQMGWTPVDGFGRFGRGDEVLKLDELGRGPSGLVRLTLEGAPSPAAQAPRQVSARYALPGGGSLDATSARLSLHRGELCAGGASAEAWEARIEAQGWRRQEAWWVKGEHKLIVEDHTFEACLEVAAPVPSAWAEVGLPLDRHTFVHRAEVHQTSVERTVNLGLRVPDGWTWRADRRLRRRGWAPAAAAPTTYTRDGCTLQAHATSALPGVADLELTCLLPPPPDPGPVVSWRAPDGGWIPLPGRVRIDLPELLAGVELWAPEDEGDALERALAERLIAAGWTRSEGAGDGVTWSRGEGGASLRVKAERVSTYGTTVRVVLIAPMVEAVEPASVAVEAPGGPRLEVRVPSRFVADAHVACLSGSAPEEIARAWDEALATAGWSPAEGGWSTREGRRAWVRPDPNEPGGGTCLMMDAALRSRWEELAPALATGMPVESSEDRLVVMYRDEPAARGGFEAVQAELQARAWVSAGPVERRDLGDGVSAQIGRYSRGADLLDLVWFQSGPHHSIELSRSGPAPGEEP